MAINPNQGQGGTPGLPPSPLMNPSATQMTDVSSKNIFDLISQGYSQSMSSALPYAQAQMGAKSAAAEPQIAAIKKQGEIGAATAQSDAGARGMRGSDIEAAGMFGARDAAFTKELEMRSGLAMQEAQFMAEQVMKSYGFDIEQNQQLFNNLAQAMGQELSRKQELEMFERQLKEMQKQAKLNSKTSLMGSLIQAGGTILGGPAGGAAAGLLTNLFKPSNTSHESNSSGAKEA